MNELNRTILKDEYPLAMHCSISEQSVSPGLLFYLLLSEKKYMISERRQLTDGKDGCIYTFRYSDKLPGITFVKTCFFLETRQNL